jgi:hypothetical protein
LRAVPVLTTVIEVARDGVTRERVFHRNRSEKAWTHPATPRARRDCGVCQGKSEAAPKEKP